MSQSPERHDRKAGCIVTWRTPDGDRVTHEPGPDALRFFLRRIPQNAEILSISTPRSIVRDLTRPTAGPRRLNDPWEFERLLLTRLGRGGLCPPLPRQLDLVPEDHRALA